MKMKMNKKKKKKMMKKIKKNDDKSSVLDIIGGGRGRGASMNEVPKVPASIEISTKDEEASDTFIMSGHNLKIDPHEVTCIREAKNSIHSAFGAQVITHGRMEWYLEIEHGFHMIVGISGVTHTTQEIFINSEYGYGYGDDGKIYYNKCFIEYNYGYKRGDVVGVHLDMDKGTLHFSVNGKDHGNAFQDIKIEDIKKNNNDKKKITKKIIK